MADSAPLLDVDFEIFGRVQGVFFRRSTQIEAKKLHLVGWVMTTHKGTVKGQVQGPKDEVEEMKKWLRTKGSKQSRIEKAEFKNEKTITSLTYHNFDIKK